MIVAPRDDNRIPTLLGVDSSLFETPTTVAVDPITHAMLVEATFTPSGTQNVNLIQVGGSAFALGQQVAAASIPVVLTALQITTLTPPPAITGFATQTTLAAILTRQNDGSQNTAISGALPAGTNTIGEVELTDGTNTANILKSDGTAAGQNAQLIGNAYQTQSYSTTTGGAQTAYMVGGYSYVAVDIQTNLSGGNTQFQISNDNTNWRNLILSRSDGTDYSSSPGNTSALYGGDVAGAKYFRLNLGGSGGTATGTIQFSTLPQAQMIMGSSQFGNWTIGSNSQTGSPTPGNAFYIGGNLAGSGTLAAPNVTSFAADTLNNGDVGIETAAHGFVYNGSSWDRQRSMGGLSGSTGLLATGIAGGLMPNGTALNTFSLHSTSNATTTPTALTAYISSIAISNEVGGTTSTITIQDKQGTPLKLVNGLATTALTTAPTIINFQTPVKMVSGIDIITAGAVAATVDIWINYYG